RRAGPVATGDPSGCGGGCLLAGYLPVAPPARLARPSSCGYSARGEGSVGYLIKATVGLALFIGGIVLFNVKLVSLLETGTCASGNTPYQISQPCPEGTGTDILLLTASIFAGLIGVAIFAFRGDPPWGGKRSLNDPGRLSTGLFAWGAFFTATGATSLMAS